MIDKTKTIIFYDGKCHLCAFEIQFYFKRDIKNALQYIDISNPAFNPSAYEIDTAKVQREFHVYRNEKMFLGVDGFIEIWDALGWKWMLKIGRFPLVNWLLKTGYFVFKYIRPLLPQRKISCAIDITKEEKTRPN
jgi:predicted DCC family thiol-disulfide oxidoreductase YuxK